MEYFDYTLRPVTPADEPFLWEMLYQAIFIPPGAIPPPREIVRVPEIARYVRNWGQADDLGLLAVDSDTQQPVGAAWLRLLTGENRGYGYIDDETPELSIALLPQHRGKGVGTQLMKGLLALAQDRYGAVSLSVNAENPAMRLYTRLGFEVVDNVGSSRTMKRDLRAVSGQSDG